MGILKSTIVAEECYGVLWNSHGRFWFHGLYRDPCSNTAMGAMRCYGVLWDRHVRDWFIELYSDPYLYTAMGAEGCYGVLWDSHGQCDEQFGTIVPMVVGKLY